ncbi:TlpA family protein disulfide reductase [Macrococcus armenti]|uniref:TlpA family protein disulfide reductase n=1 Tax=Macrococcus armenti TaxID=2875764 RepID=UPI001CCC602E|nr:TlpA disulfide reductase family protein [Macrococcus armenti]UBH13687.1 TlpA family protein disulfide reductase [Macrococcus armenti]UBH22914.1 TlpA family protein disulfide reductase [Macrococcus armenti]
MRKLITILLSLLFISLAVYSIYTVIQFNQSKNQISNKNIVSHEHPVNGKNIGDISVTDFNNHTYKLKETLKHDINIINMWASWCEPCNKEMPELIHYDQQKPNHVGLIGLNVQDKPDKRDAFIKKYGPDYPMYSLSEEITKQYKFTYVPTTLFVDKEGKVLKTYIGELNQSQIENIIQQID